MSTLLAIGLANALCATVLAIPAWLVGRSGKRPALAHALWLLVLLKLVTPPLFRPDLAWLPAEEPESVPLVARIEAAPAAGSEVLPPEAVAFVPVQDMAVQAQQNPPAVDFAVPAMVALPVTPPALPSPEPTPATPTPTREPFPILDVLGLVWLVGALLVLGRSLWYIGRFQRLLRQAERASAELQTRANQLARILGLRRAPPVWLVPGPLPPMVWAVGRPCVLFPAGLPERLGEAEFDSLLLHELAHVRRCDHWVRWLELAAVSLFWWYPLSWLARQQLQAREEECCDARVIESIEPRTYASAILDAVDFLSEAVPQVPAVASPLAGVKPLKERLTLIMTGSAKGGLGRLMRILVAVLALAVLPLLPALGRPQKQAEIVVDATNPIPEEPATEPGEYIDVGSELSGQPGDVYSVGFSPDGKYVAAGSGEVYQPGMLEVFEAATGQLRHKAHEVRGVSSVSFSADSKRVAWSGWNGIVRSRHLADGRDAFAFPLTGRNHRVSHSPDGKWLAVASEDRTLQLRNPNTGKLVDVLRGEPIDFYCVNFSGDSSLLGVGGGSFQEGKENFALLFDVATRKQKARLNGHTQAVINIAFAPRNAYIATASADRTIRIYDGANFKHHTTLTGHQGPVKGLAFSPDGKTLATGSWDGTIRLWDVKDGKTLTTLKGHRQRVREIAYSPDGKWLVSGGDGQTIKLWDVETRKEKRTLKQRPYTGKESVAVSLAVSPRGAMIAVGDEDGGIALRDGITGEALRRIKPHVDAVTALTFSPDGKALASSGPDAVVLIHAVDTGKELQRFTGHDNWVYALAWSRDGKRLASGAYDRSVRVWDPQGKEKPLVLTGNKAAIRALDFSPDGVWIAAGGTDKVVRIFDVRTAKAKYLLHGHKATVRGLVYAGDGTLYSSGEDGQVKRWKVDEEKELNTVQVSPNEVLALALSPGGTTLATGDRAGWLKTWSPETLVERQVRYVNNQGVIGVAFGPKAKQIYTLGSGQSVQSWSAIVGPVKRLDGHKGPVRVATFSRDSKHVLSCGGWPEGDRTLRLWDAITGKQLRAFEGNKGQLQAATFTADGKHALAGCDDGKIQMWEVSSGKLVRQFVGHQAEIVQLSVSKDGKWLMSASGDKTARLWDVASGETVQTLSGHEKSVRTVAFHPDGKRLLTGSWDGKIRLWTIDGKLVRTDDHQNEIEGLTLTPDGSRYVVVGGQKAGLRDLESGKLLKTFSGHAFGLTCVAMVPDGKRMLTSSYDASVVLWDLETGEELSRFRSHRNWVWGLSVSPDGKHFLSAGGGSGSPGKWSPGTDWTIRMWRLPS